MASNLLDYVFMKRRCRRGEHDWFPDLGAKEFIPLGDICLNCPAMRMTLPWGQCLGKHPIADHYDQMGQLVPFPNCPGPT